MTAEIGALAIRVREELEGYGIPEHGPRALGAPLPPEWFVENLSKMRASLVEPYSIHLAWAERDVLVVADDGEGSLVAYDPCEEGEFTLLLRENNKLYDCHVRGDVVGCFLSR